ncbi:hypothetical protein HPB48_026221 [Haemaphysalis longicornis]|uniref:Peptidase M13 N-terminal domain-containing protein n=1 Tax=Haemaphysalis longicornis TaxID=44386 RepID=A0A9J6HA91_HAELO|nr:hypothetical protein HPB48_026221 [Haemaphysalis longicornis]
MSSRSSKSSGSSGGSTAPELCQGSAVDPPAAGTAAPEAKRKKRRNRRGSLSSGSRPNSRRKTANAIDGAKAPQLASSTPRTPRIAENAHLIVPPQTAGPSRGQPLTATGSKTPTASSTPVAPPSSDGTRLPPHAAEQPVSKTAQPPKPPGEAPITRPPSFPAAATISQPPRPPGRAAENTEATTAPKQTETSHSLHGILKSARDSQRSLPGGQVWKSEAFVVPVSTYMGTPDSTADRKCQPGDSAESRLTRTGISRSSMMSTTLRKFLGRKKARIGFFSLRVITPYYTTPMMQRSVIKSVVMVGLFAGVAAIALAIVLWLAFGDDHDIYCESSDCHYHKKLITSALNWSIDPCEDFSAFACSAWQATAAYRRGSRSSLEDVVTAWTGDFESMLRKGREHLEVRKKALSMFTLCKEMKPEQVVARTEVPRKFIAERQIPWPEEALPNTRPLTVLVDLDYSVYVNIIDYFYINY